MHEYGPQKLGNLSLPVLGYGDMQRERSRGRIQVQNNFIAIL